LFALFFCREAPGIASHGFVDAGHKNAPSGAGLLCVRMNK